MWNIINKYRLAFPFIYLLFLIACGNGKTSVNSDKTIEIVNYDSSGFSCRIERIYNSEGAGLKNCQILLNDTIALFRGQTLIQQLQVTLTNAVSDYIKSLLYDIYTENRSTIKDKYINANYCISSATSKWNIMMNMDGKKINEKINISGYAITFDQPFHPQFDRLLELILAITVKMEQDIFRIENTDYNQAEWITETFHDEYYLPYNDISSHNYQ